MGFLFAQIQQLGLVAIIMACATGGTVGLLKLIRRFVPGDKFLGDDSSKNAKKR